MSKKAKDILYWSVVGILIVIILVSVGMIVHKLVSDANEQKLNEDLANKMHAVDHSRPTIPSGPVTVPSTPDVPVIPQPPKPDEIQDRFKELYDINNDMVGWIQIEGTAIDYPVVQSPYEDDYYLRRNFYKKSATSGTVYAREECSIQPASDNVVLYGHNMRNGTMFHDLINYKDIEYWKSHRYIYFDTLTEDHTYEIFAVFVTTADPSVGFRYHLYNNLSSKSAYDNYIRKCKELAYYETGITPQHGEKLLTLSTCDKEIGYGDDGRLVVIARRVV